MYQEFTPEVLVLPTPKDVDRYAAGCVIAQINGKHDSVLTLPTGATPQGMYERLVQLFKQGQVDFSRVTTFNLDEYFPIPESHPASYAEYMKTHFFRHVNVPSSNIYLPNGQAESAHTEATRFDRLIQQRGPVDLAVLGIGPGKTCHIGFNERGSQVDSRTRYMPLDPQTREANAVFFKDPNEMPVGSITQGIRNILEAQRILLIAKGERKAWGIKRSLTCKPSSDVPASFLRFHPDVCFILDEGAAELLRSKYIALKK